MINHGEQSGTDAALQWVQSAKSELKTNLSSDTLAIVSLIVSLIVQLYILQIPNGK